MTGQETCIRNVALCSAVLLMAACNIQPSRQSPILQRTVLELVDWNRPVLWVRIANYNLVPVTNAQIVYEAHADGQESKGTFTIKEAIPAGAVRNFVNIRLATVSPQSEKISLKLIDVEEIR